jgi:hypothetical protein
VTGRIEQDGAVVTVRVGLGAAEIRNRRRLRMPIPQTIDLTALLDTGAEVSCIDTDAVAGLGLPYRAMANANLPALGGFQPAVFSAAALTIVHPDGNPHSDLVVSDIELMEVALAPLGYSALIGRDVLGLCKFHYNDPRANSRRVLTPADPHGARVAASG